MSVLTNTIHVALLDPAFVPPPTLYSGDQMKMKLIVSIALFAAMSHASAADVVFEGPVIQWADLHYSSRAAEAPAKREAQSATESGFVICPPSMTFTVTSATMVCKKVCVKEGATRTCTIYPEGSIIPAPAVAGVPKSPSSSNMVSDQDAARAAAAGARDMYNRQRR